MTLMAFMALITIMAFMALMVFVSLTLLMFPWGLSVRKKAKYINDAHGPG